MVINNSSRVLVCLPPGETLDKVFTTLQSTGASVIKSSLLDVKYHKATLYDLVVLDVDRGNPWPLIVEVETAKKPDTLIMAITDSCRTKDHIEVHGSKRVQVIVPSSRLTQDVRQVLSKF